MFLPLLHEPAAPVRHRGHRHAGAGRSAFSRLTLGVHYVSDVLGGYALGAAWLTASVAAFEIWREDRGRRPTHPLEEGVEPEEAREVMKSRSA